MDADSRAISGRKAGRMKLIVVTRDVDGEKMYVNADMVCAVYPYYKKENLSVIQFAGAEENYVTVTESVETIANMME